MDAPDPMTIATALERIRSNRYVLPDIQRPFIWRQAQIYKLFDSVMRGYPIGSLLLWRVKATKASVGFVRFTTNHYHDCPSEPVHTDARVTAVLDGQQRLTALNLGLQGSLRNAKDSERRHLHLDLSSVTPDAGSQQLAYRFEFKTPQQAEQQRDDEATWFRVSDILRLKTEAQLERRADKAGFGKRSLERRSLRRLREAVHIDVLLPAQVERSADLYRVLNIFARINTGGTRLTYAQLLASIATTRWKNLNARAELEALQSRLNSIGEGFGFGVERIMRAALVLTDAKDVRFRPESFTRSTMLNLERDWSEFCTALEIAVQVLSQMGLSGRTLTAENVIIPVAYYAKRSGLKKSYAHAASHSKDRDKIHTFAARTLLKPGFWTGDVNRILVETRRVIQRNDSGTFPLDYLEAALQKAGKPTTFSSIDIAKLLGMRYGSRQTLLILRVMYPHIQPSERLDKDHIFPRSRFTQEQFRRHGIALGHLDAWAEKAEQLPNLQLLEKADNESGAKGTKLPHDWIMSLSPAARRKYRRQHLKLIPKRFDEFEGFWDIRREHMEQRLIELLGPVAS